MVPYWNFGNDAFVEQVWPEAADIDPNVYAVLMRTANALCIAFAPLLPEGADVPELWKVAEIYQARHTWSQMSGGQQQQFGPDGQEIPVYPLVFAARDLLRPQTSPLKRVR